MYIKICGIQKSECAEKAIEAGADALGFIFYGKSKRNVSGSSLSWIADLSRRIETVGVFVGTAANEIQSVVNRLKLSSVQLHGDENVSDYFAVGVPLIQAIKSFKQVQQLRDGDRLLFDSALGVEKAMQDRSCVSHIMSELIVPENCFLSGGLDSENIFEIVRRHQPRFLDVCRGVELSDGRKDLGKMKRFVREARDAIRG